jgi:hypothetical protein
MMNALMMSSFILGVIMLNLFMPGAIMKNVIMPSVILPNAVVPICRVSFYNTKFAAFLLFSFSPSNLSKFIGSHKNTGPSKSGACIINILRS